jgi:branched-chain amino acid transport system permease protein
MKRRHIKQIALLAAILLSVLASRFSGNLIDAYKLQVVIFIGINIILAVSLNLINGYTGQFSLGHAGFVALGAYAAGLVSLPIALPSIDYPEFSTGRLTYIFKLLIYAGVHVTNAAVQAIHWLPPWMQFLSALTIGGIVAALAGFTVGVPSLRLRGDYLAIVTLGFNQIIVVLIQNIEFIGGARGLPDIPNYTTLAWTFSFAALTVYLVVSLIDSTYGRGFLAVRDDEIAAEAMGINTTKYKVVAFVIGSFFAGIAGALYAHTTTYINPAGFDFQLSIQIVIMVILGGMGNTAGVAFAAVLLTVLLEYLRFVAGYEFLPNWVRELARNRNIIFSLVLIALMLLRPQGLFGGLRAFGGGPTRKSLKTA